MAGKGRAWPGLRDEAAAGGSSPGFGAGCCWECLEVSELLLLSQWMENPSGESGLLLLPRKP